MNKHGQAFEQAVAAAVHELLMEKGRVVLPDWGALLAHPRPARYQRLRALYHPPGYRFSFNPMITSDNGELFALLHRQWGWDLAEITQMWQALIAQWQAALSEVGRALLPGVGSFIRQGEQIIFKENPESAYRPDTWLLPIIRMPVLQSRRPAAPETAPAPSAALQWWKAAAIWALVIVGLAILWQLPPRPSEAYSRAGMDWTTPATAPPAPSEKPAPSSRTTAATVPQQAQQAAASPAKYYIIVGSYRRARRAQQYARRLRRQGIDARVLPAGRRYRVAAVAVGSQAEARQLLPFIRHKTGRPDAWIYAAGGPR